MYIVDRIIDGILICEIYETGEIVKFETNVKAKEGDVVKIVDDKVVIDYELTKQRKLKIAEKFKRLKRQ